MFDLLSDKLQNIFKGLQGAQVINDETIEEGISEVKSALIDADVSLKAVKTFVNRVHEKSIGEKVTKGVSSGNQFIKIIHDELVSLLGTSQNELNISEKPSIVLMLGLQGTGKTTTCAKLAKYFKKKNKKPLLVPLDLKRPAAIEQLEILGREINVPVYNIKNIVEAHGRAPLHAQNAIQYAKDNDFDVVILDSAGRLQIDTELMAELLLIDRVVQPQEKLLVVDSMTGQEAASVASSFDIQIGITGIVLTKLDGDARGGAALSVVEETGKPIKLVGIGEKLDDIQEFYPDRIASRILGMGDVLTLVEQAQEKIKEDEVKELERKLLSDFNFETFLQAQNMMGKLGDFSNIFNMMGMGGMLSQFGVNLSRDTQEKMLSEGETRLKKYKTLIQSMTKKERTNPGTLTPSRNRRIAKGSGYKEKDVEKLYEEFRQMKKTMDKIKPLLGMFQEQGMPSLDLSKKSQGGIQKGFKPKKK